MLRQKAIDMRISKDDVHDSKVALDIMNGIIKDINIDKLYADGTYDNLTIYKMLEDKNVEAIIKPRRNARDDSISNIRNR